MNFSQHKISVFGDSFILGQEVNDDETIAHYLSLKTKTSVHNYGVGGHGPDQTYLKFLKTLKAERPEIAIFGVFGSGINRIMNTFRPFTLGMSDIKLGFKPYFEKIQDGYRLVPPPRSIRDKKELLEALTENAKKDFWFQYDQVHKPKVAFPFSYNLLKTFMARQNHQTWLRNGELFHNEEATAKLEYILKLFIEECRRNNIRPIILFIPSNNDVLSFVTNGSYPYSRFIENFRKKSNVEVLDVLSMKNVDWRKFFLKPFYCHASPQGNAGMAELIYSQIYLNK